VHNPEGVSKGVKRMKVDGAEVAGNLVPLGLSGNEHTVELWMG